jgi:hypothetical protein
MRGWLWWWMSSEVGPQRGCKTYFQKVKKKMKKMNLFFFFCIGGLLLTGVGPLHPTDGQTMIHFTGGGVHQEI